MFKGTTIEELMSMVERAEVHTQASPEQRQMWRRDPAHQMPVLMFEMGKKSQGFVGVA
jgi:hypothetical protein